MRRAFLLLLAAMLGFTGCKRSDHSASSAPTGTDKAPPAPPPPAPPIAEDPPRKANPAGANELLAALSKFGAYENTFGKRGGNFVHIMFRSPGPNDSDLAAMRPALLNSSVPIRLNLNGCEFITDAGLAQLKNLPTLRELNIENRNQKVTDAGMALLASLTDLEGLSISGDGITDAGLVHIGKLTKLRNLSIYSKSTTDAGYAHLAGLVNLEEIHVGGIGKEIGDECLGAMKRMTKLKKLQIGSDKLTDAGMAYVRNFTELRELWIDSSEVTKAGVAHLAPLKKLEKLTVLKGTGFTGDALAALEGMTQLRELELIYTAELDKAGGLHIGKLNGLKKLRLGSVANDGMEGVGKLAGLESLDMNYSRVGDDGLKYLSGMKSLADLNLYATDVTDAGLKYLAGLPGLRDLSVAKNDITDAGLAHLAAVPNLEIIGLSECKVTGSGLKDLARLPRLKELWITGNPITDDHVMALKDIRKLKEINLAGTKVSEEKAFELKKARPEMRVRDVGGNEVALDKKPTPAPKRQPVEDISKIAPSFKLTAAEFHKEYESGRNAAAVKYKGKVIELSGVVDGIGRSGTEPYVTLKVEDQLIGVMCVTAEDEPWLKAVPGQKVKIKGKWPEFSVSPALIHCVFVDTGDYKGISISAIDLAKEFAADPEAALKKYDGRYLIVAGEVVSKDYNSAGACSIELKTGNKVKVMCSLTAFEKDAVKPIKVGQDIKMIGEFTLNFGTNDEVTLYFCLPIKGP